MNIKKTPQNKYDAFLFLINIIIINYKLIFIAANLLCYLKLI